MSVTVSVLLVAGAAVLGALVAGVLAPRWRARRPDRRARAEWLRMSDVLDRVVAGSAGGVAVVDRFGDVVLHNPRAEELGLVHERRMDPRAFAAVEETFRTRLPTAVVLTAEEGRPGRAPLAVVGAARPLSDDDAQFVVVEARDESEQVRLESTRRDFVANVSHELKTPVSAMGLLAEAMLDSADDPEVVRHFGTRLLNESNRLGALVTELIALSRLQGAQALPRLDVVDVDDVVAQALRRTTVVAEAAEIRVTADAPSGLEVSGDPTLLVTALANLVENAIAYSPAGSPVSVSRAVRQGRVEVSVTDRGIGIAPEHHERVFERFFRIDPARSRSTGGTGLGLAIVKHVAANHDGGIRLWSRPGTGSTFTLWLPAHTEEPDASTEIDDRCGDAAVELETRAGRRAEPDRPAPSLPRTAVAAEHGAPR